jgi:hypothetical protein
MYSLTGILTYELLFCLDESHYQNTKNNDNDRTGGITHPTVRRIFYSLNSLAAVHPAKTSIHSAYPLASL